MSEIERDNYVYPGKRFAKSGQIIGEGQGISLRDYFAGQALKGFCTGLTGNEGDFQWMHQNRCDGAYRIADAMLAARDADQ